MKATIANFRGGRHTQYSNQMILVVDNITSKEKASELVGKEVVWKSPAGKELSGKIASVHGNKGAIRALFNTGMPGQSIGQSIEIK